MKLTFLGTGTSMGVPVSGGFSYDKPSLDPRDFRYRVSAWVQTEKLSILIDAGPDFRFQSLRSGLKRIDVLLLTHEHVDHIGGLDDLRPFNYVQGKPIKTIASPTCIDSIKERFPYMFPPNKTPGSVDFKFLSTREYEPISIGDVTITPLPSYHGNLRVWGYKINDLVFITDVSEVPFETIDACKKCSHLVMSALRMNPTHPTHYTIPEALKVIEEINPKKTWLIHMNSQVKHTELEKELPENVHFAHDLLTVNIS